MSKSNDTKLKILNAGLRCWPDISSRSVASACEMTHSAILHHFSGAGTLEQAIIDHAVDIGDKRVMRLLICADHPTILHIDPLERAEWFAGI